MLYDGDMFSGFLVDDFFFEFWVFEVVFEVVCMFLDI